ncbi:hypothetical protein FRX31_005640 [Thalictrum thalictroides]|uniref:Uncharacterized protein n=1 Tax=Thalictrum thalictroides TaxID=46969 RepID=A0A7J6X5W3_THATH|nr:hypothetical protein FRX31_005640 [Thalictrum thalictroides]
MPCELTGRQTFENDLKDNILGSIWDNDYLGSDAMTRSRKRLPTSFYYAQQIEIDEFGVQIKRLAPNDMFIGVDTGDTEQKLYLSPHISFSGIFAISSRSTSELTRNHTMPESNDLSLDFVCCHPTDEVSFGEESDLLDNSFGNFGKLSSNRLSTSSAWSLLSPYSPFVSVAWKIGHYTDECAPNRNFVPCKSLGSFRDR